MQTVELNGIKFNKISKEEMAAYIEKIFNNEKVKDAILNQDRRIDARNLNDLIFEFCTMYARSTGDLSEEAVEKIAARCQDGFAEYNVNKFKPQKYNGSAKAAYFDQTTGPLITKFWAEQLSLNKLSIASSIDILSAVSTANMINCFDTHSFSGALFDEVNQNGLDISKEMFRDEYQTLAKIGSSPYIVGKLFNCEMSYATIGYTYSSPERLRMTLSASGKEQGREESDNAFLNRMLIEKIESAKLSEEDKNACLAAGRTMIDFYEQSTSSAIAIMDGQRQEKFMDMTEGMLKSLPNIEMYISYKNRKLIPKELFTELKSVVKDSANPSRIANVEEVLTKIKAVSPEVEKEINILLKEAWYNKKMTESAISNFETANATGYEVTGGKISRQDMGIAHFTNLVKEYPLYQAKLAEAEDEI